MSILPYLGLAGGSFLAATIVPFSSELMLAGMLAGGYNPWLCFLAASLGNTGGGMTGYILGRAGSTRILTRWMRIKEDKLERMLLRVRRWGLASAFLCWLPVVGDLICVALGIIRMPWLAAMLAMGAGKAARYALIVWVWQ